MFSDILVGLTLGAPVDRGASLSLQWGNRCRQSCATVSEGTGGTGAGEWRETLSDWSSRTAILIIIDQLVSLLLSDYSINEFLKAFFSSNILVISVKGVQLFACAARSGFIQIFFSVYYWFDVIAKKKLSELEGLLTDLFVCVVKCHILLLLIMDLYDG